MKVVISVQSVPIDPQWSTTWSLKWLTVQVIWLTSVTMVAINIGPMKDIYASHCHWSMTHIWLTMLRGRWVHHSIDNALIKWMTYPSSPGHGQSLSTTTLTKQIHRCTAQSPNWWTICNFDGHVSHHTDWQKLWLYMWNNAEGWYLCTMGGKQPLWLIPCSVKWLTSEVHNTNHLFVTLVTGKSGTTWMIYIRVIYCHWPMTHTWLTMPR